jgi:ABC transport system ATP-binding/permease protein
MNYLTLENVTKSYGPKILFRDVSLHINKGDKIALVAKNGTGKTTLMRVLAGSEGSEGENATILIAKDIRTGFLVQDPDLDASMTVEQAVFDSENLAIRAVKDYEHALLDTDNAEALQHAMAQMDELRAWDTETRVQEILSKLRLDNLQQRVSTLSGGQKKRLALAKMLLDEPDFLILDEPTNHLDLDMIEWLEQYLSKSTLTLFMVTHDRYFLDAVCNTIIELEYGKFFRYKGNYAAYLEQKALRSEIEAAEMGKARKLYSRELEWMRRQPQARSTKAKSRIDDFYELQGQVKVRQDKTTLEMDIKTTWMGSKIVELHNVSKAYGDKKMVDQFSYKFKRGERVGIVGSNGVGKSTFLRLLLGETEPDAGKVVIGETIQFGYYNQDGMQLKEDRRVIEVITDIAEYIPLEKGAKMTAAALLERFLFSREQQQVYASQLSGGEKRRLYLLTVLIKNPNFLILDEPTNDIDIVTLNVLEEFLESIFKGCLIVVTHDRYFMDNIVEHLFIFEGDGQIRDYNGNYSEYREERKQLERNTPKSAPAKPVAIAAPTATRGLNDTERKELKRLEREIAQLETRKTDINLKFNDTTLSGEQITKWAKELAIVQHDLEEKETRWLELSELA